MTAPVHEPKLCSSCSAPILWAQTLDRAGKRFRRDDDKGWKSMPVDFEPSPAGNVQVFHREGEGIVCRVFKDAASAPPGARLRTSHFQTCPQAAEHRRPRGARRPRGGEGPRVDAGRQPEVRGLTAGSLGRGQDLSGRALVPETCASPRCTLPILTCLPCQRYPGP